MNIRVIFRPFEAKFFGNFSKRPRCARPEKLINLKWGRRRKKEPIFFHLLLSCLGLFTNFQVKLRPFRRDFWQFFLNGLATLGLKKNSILNGVGAEKNSHLFPFPILRLFSQFHSLGNQTSFLSFQKVT